MLLAIFILNIVLAIAAISVIGSEPPRDDADRKSGCAAIFVCLIWLGFQVAGLVLVIQQ